MVISRFCCSSLLIPFSAILVESIMDLSILSLIVSAIGRMNISLLLESFLLFLFAIYPSFWSLSIMQVTLANSFLDLTELK